MAGLKGCGRMSVASEWGSGADGRGHCAEGGSGEARLRDSDVAAGARRRRERGLTALELVVALVIAGLLTSLAVPGFASLRRSAGLSSAANELVWALHMARSSAVLRGLPVVVCLTGRDGVCLAAPDLAAAGWLVFLPAGPATATRAAPVGEVLHRFTLPTGVTVSGTRPAVTFWPVTRASSTSTFDLCETGSRSQGRSIVVSQTGRPRVAAEAIQCAG